MIVVMWFNNYPILSPIPEAVEGIPAAQDQEPNNGELLAPAHQNEERQPAHAEQAIPIDQHNVDAVVQQLEAEQQEVPEQQGEGGGERSMPFSQSNHKEKTRSQMASVFILGFFAIILMCFVYAGWLHASINEIKDMIIAVIGALSGLVGFVIVYLINIFFCI